MTKSTTIIEFGSIKTVNYSFNEIIPVKINFFGNSYNQIKFKIHSRLFGTTSYIIKKPSYLKEYIHHVVFTYPLKDESIRLIPISNCEVGVNHTLNTNFVGEINDIRGIEIDYKAKPLSDFCNLDSIVLSNSFRSTSFEISGYCGDRTTALYVKKLSNDKDKIQENLLNTLGQYNSSYYLWKMNKNLTESEKLFKALKQSEITLLREQFQLETDLLKEVEKNFRKISNIILSSDTVIQLTARNTSLRGDCKSSEVLVRLDTGNYFCLNHPHIIVTTFSEDFTIQPIKVKALSDTKYSFDVNPYYSEDSFDFIPEQHASDNEIVEKLKKNLLFWRTYEDKYSTYFVKAVSCGFPDTLNSTKCVPVKELETELRVYSADEFAFLFNSEYSDSVEVNYSKNLNFNLSYQRYSIRSEDLEQNNFQFKENGSFFSNYSLTANNQTDCLHKKMCLKNTFKYKNILKIINSVELSENYLKSGNAGFLRNGVENRLISSKNYVVEQISSLISRVKSAYLNFSNISYNSEVNYYHKLEMFKGSLSLKWGIKNYVNNTVISWKKLFSNMKIFENEIDLSFNSFWGAGSKLLRGRIVLSSNGTLVYDNSQERTAQHDYYRYYTIAGVSSLSPKVHMFLNDDSATYTTEVISSGLEGEVESSYKIQNEGKKEFESRIRFSGIALRFETRMPLLKTYVYTKNIIEPYPGGSEIKNISLPGIFFKPYPLQAGFDKLYNKTVYQYNRTKETLANIYFLHSQLISKNSLINNIKEVCYDSDGNFPHLKMGDLTSVSEYVKQWRMYLENVDFLDVPKMFWEGRMRSVFSELMNERKTFSKTEDSQIGSNVFKITFLLAYICDFLEKKLMSLSDYKERVRNDIEYMIQTETDIDIQSSCDEYENILSSIESKYEQLINLEYEILQAGIPEKELDLITKISHELGLPENINYSLLDNVLDSLNYYKLALEKNFLERKYWINHTSGKLSTDLKLIFPSPNINGDDEDEK